MLQVQKIMTMIFHDSVYKPWISWLLYIKLNYVHVISVKSSYQVKYYFPLITLPQLHCKQIQHWHGWQFQNKGQHHPSYREEYRLDKHDFESSANLVTSAAMLGPKIIIVSTHGWELKLWQLGALQRHWFLYYFSFVFKCCTCDCHWGDCSMHFHYVVIRHSLQLLKDNSHFFL